MRLRRGGIKAMPRLTGKNTSPVSGPREHLVLAEHCENLARAYRQAADENTALAKLHRELAAAAK